MSPPTFWTPSGVRLRQRSSTPGRVNWLFLPGGPGIGSDSLEDLADIADLPGTTWMVDLPGDGSNTDAPGGPTDPFSLWPQVLLEAAQAVPNAVYLGHSTGGMYLLSTPALADHVAGLVLISTAPDASWLPAFVAMTQVSPLPAVDAATAVYENDPSDAHLAAIAVASAEWNFGSGSVNAGRDFLKRMPYNGRAVDWSDRHFDHDYVATWWPETVPTLIVSGSDDRIVTQGLWDDDRFRGPNVERVVIENGQHFPWFENPTAVRDALKAFAERVTAG